MQQKVTAAIKESGTATLAQQSYQKHLLMIWVISADTDQSINQAKKTSKTIEEQKNKQFKTNAHKRK